MIAIELIWGIYVLEIQASNGEIMNYMSLSTFIMLGSGEVCRSWVLYRGEIPCAMWLSCSQAEVGWSECGMPKPRCLGFWYNRGFNEIVICFSRAYKSNVDVQPCLIVYAKTLDIQFICVAFTTVVRAVCRIIKLLTVTDKKREREKR